MTTRTPCWVANVERCPCCGGRHTVWADRPFRWVRQAYECPQKRERCVVAGSCLVGREAMEKPVDAVEAHEDPPGGAGRGGGG